MMSSAAACDNSTTTGREFNTFTSDTPNKDDNGLNYIPSHWLSATFVVTAIVAAFGNISVLMTFATKRKLLKKNFNVLILNLALVDLIVGVFDLPLQVRYLHSSIL